MNLRPLFRMIPLSVALGLALSSVAARADDKAPHWAYTGHGGAEHWSKLDAKFETCANGKRQSPIDIRKTTKGDLTPLDFKYTSVAPTFVNNGHTVQLDIPAGQSLVVGTQTYQLLQFHFHTPSEEAVNGKRSAMVAHFVHKNAEGQLGVVGVLFEPGKKNAAWAPVFEHLPKNGQRLNVDKLQLDLAALLPAERGYYNFEGSLTTPPCSESVNWMVLKTPVRLGADQIKAFRRLYNANARPLQPVNDRVVKESN